MPDEGVEYSEPLFSQPDGDILPEEEQLQHDINQNATPEPIVEPQPGASREPPLLLKPSLGLLRPPEIACVVASGDTSLGHVDLKTVYLRCRGAAYDPNGIPCVRIPLRSIHNMSVNLYPSGKFTVVGAHSLEDAAAAARILLSLLRSIGFQNAYAEGVTVSNIVAVGSVPFAIQIDKLAQSLAPLGQYLPEVKPSATIRLVKPENVIFHVYANGRVVIVGAHSIDELNDAWRSFFPVACEHRATVQSSAADA